MIEPAKHDVIVIADHGHVIIDFVEHGYWVSFVPSQARALADLLVEASFGTRKRPAAEHRRPEERSDAGRPRVRKPRSP
jgi:hypothetical protein